MRPRYCRINFTVCNCARTFYCANTKEIEVDGTRVQNDGTIFSMKHKMFRYLHANRTAGANKWPEPVCDATTRTTTTTTSDDFVDMVVAVVVVAAVAAAAHYSFGNLMRCTCDVSQIRWVQVTKKKAAAIERKKKKDGFASKRNGNHFEWQCTFVRTICIRQAKERCHRECVCVYAFCAQFNIHGQCGCWLATYPSTSCCLQHFIEWRDALHTATERTYKR